MKKPRNPLSKIQTGMLIEDIEPISVYFLMEVLDADSSRFLMLCPRNGIGSSMILLLNRP